MSPLRPDSRYVFASSDGGTEFCRCATIATHPRIGDVEDGIVAVPRKLNCVWPQARTGSEGVMAGVANTADEIACHGPMASSKRRESECADEGFEKHIRRPEGGSQSRIDRISILLQVTGESGESGRFVGIILVPHLDGRSRNGARCPFI